MHVGEAVKCAEGGIMMIHTWITGSSRILLLLHPFAGRTVSTPAHKEDAIRKENLLNALSNLFSGCATFHSRATVFRSSTLQWGWLLSLLPGGSA